ncbi:MAG: PA14 domain-containing protein [Agriterribacter sp.]
MKTIMRCLGLISFFVFSIWSFSAYAQSPGGVTSGSTRGWKIEHFDGDFGSNLSAFGLGSANTTPDLWGYTGYINGSEFTGYDATYFGLQYSGTLEVPQTGSYSFNVYNIDDHASLYVDGVQKAIYTWSGSPGNITATVSLSSGDHTILLKFINNGGPGVINIRWSGPGITSNSDLDGRFVRSDNAALTGWYKGSDVSITANYSGTTAKLNGFTNKAPSFSGNGNLTYRAGVGWGQYDSSKFNFNAGGIYDGDDGFISPANQNGLSFRSAPRTVFLIANYTANLTSAQWLWGQSAGDGTTTNGTGIYKSSGTQTAMARNGSALPLVTSTYTANEPKLITGDITLGTGNTASANNNRSTSANGSTSVTTGYTEVISNYNNNCCALEWGNTLSSYTNGAGMPELIYYPFELSANQRQRVNTYLAIKYGITLQHNYLSTSGSVLWDITANAAYSNRIFGIGRELTAEALNQKQSQSQMASAAGYDFITVAKGTIATTNASNTGALSDGDYMILGDNNGALASQSTGIPTSFTTASGGCTTARLTRQWKVQTAGSPGAVTLRAGSSSFLFPSLAAGLAVMVDIDGDGDFTTGTVNTYPASVNNAGIATFPNVTIPNGAVISFAWVVTSPGGVSTGLALWLKADAGTSSTTSGAAITTWIDQSANATGTGSATYYNNGTNNYNPYISYNGSSNYFAMPAGYANFTGGLSSYFVASFNNTTQNWVRFFDFGNGSANNNLIFAKSSTTATLGIIGYNAGASVGTTASTASTIVANTTRIYGGFLPAGVAGATVTGSLYNNGLSLAVSGTTNMSANISRTINYIGRSNWAADDYFSGTHSEDIIYNTVLTATQQKQVNSYLAVKYGLTLDVSLASYLASDGTTVIWNKTAYWNNVFGIGRDDCSGLLQKQSKSVVTGDNVSISLGTLAATNAANTGSFAANKQFIIVGNDGNSFSTIATDIPASFGGASCNARRYAREWKVQNTGSTGAVTVTIGDATNKVKTSMTNLQLAVDIDGDGDFTTGTPVLYTRPA